ncbi:MAG TPA: transposase [Planctomycetota bacterium]|nr:transposase [Planctomycetota bacterium]
MRMGLASSGDMEQSTPHRKRNKKYIIHGHAPFKRSRVTAAWLFSPTTLGGSGLRNRSRAKCDEFEYALWGYVFMPEHVHLLLKPHREMYDLSKFEQSFKLSFSRKLIVHLSRVNSPLMQSLRVKNGYRVWQEGGGHDLNIWSMKKAVEKAEYCHGNPVKRRLMKSAAEWRWSSFRWLVQGKREDAPLRLDEWDETLLEG